MTYMLILFWHFVTHRWTRYAAAWLVALGLAAHLQHKAYHDFDSRDPDPQKRRHDGNDGHTSIDFGGQWILGRMLVLGHGRELYDRRRLYEVAQRVYPRADESPATLEELPRAPPHDADSLLSAFIEVDIGPRAQSLRNERERFLKQTFVLPLSAQGPLDAAADIAVLNEHWPPERLAELGRKHVGGPLYPPTHALIFAPLALGDHPRWAYRITQWIMLLAGFVAGLGVSVLTRRRIWWPVATVLVMLYPGFSGDHALGQNGPVSLAILVWGWALMSRGYDTGGGLVWGLLAFKPVWAVAFLLAPLVTGRWRTGLAMIAVGAAMAAATLPFVGVETWIDWLHVGEVANRTYGVDGNWLQLSRDLLGIPRRFLIDTENREYFDRDRWEAHVASWALLLFVVEATVRLSRLWPERFRAMNGPAAGFLLLGAWMSCIHFMYYDVLLSAVAFLVLLDPPAEIFRRKFVGFGGAAADDPLIDYYRPRLAESYPGAGRGTVWVANSFLIYFAILLLVVQHTLPWLGLGLTLTAHRGPLAPVASVSAGEVVVKDGKTVWHTPKIEIGTLTNGPPWDTYCLLFLWAWCGVCVVLAGLETKRKEAG